MNRCHFTLLISLILLGTAPSSGNAKETCQADRVALDTDLGTIVVQVFPKAAPASASDFLKYVDQGRYRGAGFYRTVRSDNDNGTPKIDVVQGGLLENVPDLPTVAHESTGMTGLRHVDGSLSLARRAPGTASAASFFITIGDQPALDQGGTRNTDKLGFAVFGRVIRGMKVVRKIHAVPAAELGGSEYMKGQILNNPIMIRNARRLCGRAGSARHIERSDHVVNRSPQMTQLPDGVGGIH